MAFDQGTRNRLARFVSDARILLTEEFTRQLQNEYGLDPDSGEVTRLDKLTALDDTQRETTRILRETLDYYLAGKTADAKKRKDVLQRIVREQAFTILNRLCALRMAESRGILLESIARGYQSKGFQLYARLAGTGLGEKGDAYRAYLFSLFDEFAVDLRVLFDRFSPQGRLFPRQTALIKLLELINDPEIDHLWAEDETIGWMYQYFNTKEERQEMRASSSAPRNSRELAVRNQFFTPRYVVEFLTDNTLGRIWYEMTKGETALKDTCLYLVRKKYPFFLKGAEEIPQPFDPDNSPMGDPDLPGEMWVRPNPELSDISRIFRYALTVGGYDYARKHLGKECADLANPKLGLFRKTGKWDGSFEELRCCLFFEQRRYHHFGQDPEGEEAIPIHALYQVICERWDLETEFIVHRSIKDPRELKMLDPACGSMHFGLYAFDLFEQIYTEAWDLEEKLGKDALWRLPDLDALHDTYPNREAFLRDVPRLIIERNIHGVDIDPRAVQISGLSLWLRAQKSWQAQSVKPQERPQVRRSNVVYAESMPGDRALLEEFLQTLKENRLETLIQRALHVPAGQKVRATKAMADALAHLVRTVWQEMELAGEAGSLLKIEETLRQAISTARKESDEKAPLFHLLEYGIGEPSVMQYVHAMEGEEQDFWHQAEHLVLVALETYAEQAASDGSIRRRLFADDAVQGFAFINLCQKRYDVVLMNPPFGAACESTKANLSKSYFSGRTDLYACFIQRALQVLSASGSIGAITARTGFYLQSFSEWRNNILKTSDLICFADLGSGVLDSAMVETAAYVLGRSPNKQIPFYRLDSENKAKVLEKAIICLFRAEHNESTFILNPHLFETMPDKAWSYWVSISLLRIFSTQKGFEPNYGNIRLGVQTNDDFRFSRLWWEIPNNLIGINTEDSYSGKEWVTFLKGGDSSRYFAEISMLLSWKNEGEELKAAISTALGGGHWSRHIQSLEYYFLPGASWAKRTSSFNPHIVPSGCISSVSRYFALPKDISIATMVAIWNTPIMDYLAKLRMESWSAPIFGISIIKDLPFPSLSREQDRILGLLALKIWQLKWELAILDETGRFVFAPFVRTENSLEKIYKQHLNQNEDIQSRSKSLRNEIELLVYSVLGVASDLIDDPFLQFAEEPINKEVFSLFNTTFSILSYILGAIFARWNIQCLMGEKIMDKSIDPLSPLPISPPGMLQNASGLPATSKEVPADYPLRINWGGVLVDDEGHNESIEERVGEALHIIWGKRAEYIEAEACQILAVHSLREYFQKPTLFFAEHLAHYSKSRRQAPIYWPLSTPSNSYTLWLYYHRLSDQTLFTCDNDFIDPKLEQVSEEASRLRMKKGRSASDEKELERLTDFERELKDFRDELLRVAKFWKPDLNDGVQITAAPLWKLFQYKPWQKKLKETWESLEAGEYDWAHLAYSIWPERVREKCKIDKSLAIAHDLEHLYVEPKAPMKKKAGRKKDSEMEEMFNED